MPRAGLVTIFAIALAPPAGVVAPLVVLASLAGAETSASAQAPFLTLIGFAPGTEASRIYGLSADGRSASGFSQEPTSVNTHYPGLRWNANTGRQDFGVGLPPALTLGFGISGDGSTIVGGAKTAEGSASPSTAFRWSDSGGFSSLGTLPGYVNSEARDANHDGSVIVGTVSGPFGVSPQGFLWTQSGGMQGLGAGTTGHAISRDGSTIIGVFGTEPNAFRWTQAGGLQFLPTLSGVGPSYAGGINNDGSIIVGSSGIDSRPTMWINGTPTEILPGSSNIFLSPYALNDAGTVILGQGQPIGSPVTFPAVWTPATGTIRLTDYLAANGLTLPAGLELYNATAMSADGLTFAGWTTGAFGTQGYVATIPSPCPADLDNDGLLTNGGTPDHAVTIDDLLFLLAAFEAGNLAADLDNGSNTGTRDNAVTIEDLLYFLAHFEAGC